MRMDKNNKKIVLYILKCNFIKYYLFRSNIDRSIQIFLDILYA